MGQIPQDQWLHIPSEGCGEREKYPDTGGNQTMQLQDDSMSLNHETTSAPNLLMNIVHFVQLFLNKHNLSTLYKIQRVIMNFRLCLGLS